LSTKQRGHVQSQWRSEGVAGGGGPPPAELLWGRHYGLFCRLQTCKGCIEIKVVFEVGTLLAVEGRFWFWAI